MKKRVTTIITIIAVFLLTILIYYVSSNINEIRDKVDTYLDSKTTTKTTTTRTTTSRTTTTTTKYAEIDIDSMLKHVKKEKGKVNIYFFYGKGCPHCEHEHEAFDEIKSQYGKYYNLYEFEIWYNPKNRSLAHKFAEKMNTEVSGVPFTVIGEQYMSGFGSNSKEKLIELIKTEKDKGYDVYFDEMKEQ